MSLLCDDPFPFIRPSKGFASWRLRRTVDFGPVLSLPWRRERAAARFENSLHGCGDESARRSTTAATSGMESDDSDRPKAFKMEHSGA
jgi:hypothetical protein